MPGHGAPCAGRWIMVSLTDHGRDQAAALLDILGLPAHRGPAPGRGPAGAGTRPGPPEPDPHGRHRQRQDLHHGQHRAAPPTAHPGHCPQQDPGRPAGHGVQGVLPPTTPWSTSSPTTTTISRRPTSPRPTPTSRRTPTSTRRSTSSATPPPGPC